MALDDAKNVTLSATDMYDNSIYKLWMIIVRVRNFTLRID